MPSPADIAADMVKALAVVEPDLDTSIGTPIRKILDTVAESIAEAYIDSNLLTYQWDIDSRFGADLDSFVGQFGFARIPARRATGTALFSQGSVLSTVSLVIPAGTQLATADTPPLIVQTTSPVLFPQTALNVTAPIQAVTGGAAGNLPANSIVRVISPINGVAAVSNPSSMTGGSDGESDDQLRARFKSTLFRNLAGTKDMYLGVALNDPDVANAVVLTAEERFRERIEVISGTATSTIAPLDRERNTLVVTAATNASPIVITTRLVHGLRPNDIVNITGCVGNTAANGTWRVLAVPSTTTFSIQNLDGVTASSGNGAWSSGGTVKKVTRARYLYPSGYAFGSDLDNGLVLTPGVHYTLDTTQIPPVVTVLDAATVPDGIYELSMLYGPHMSRNDVPKGITNRVDIWTDGNRSLSVTETVIIDGTLLFTSTATDTYSAYRFHRLDGTNPAVGDVFIPLAFRPVTAIPTSISLGSVNVPATATNINLVRERGVNFGSPFSLDGISLAAAEVQTGTINISSSTNATPIVLTTAAHTFQPGQRIKVAGHTTNTNANGVWIVGSAGSGFDATHIPLLKLDGTNSTGNGVGGATGTVSLYHAASINYTINNIPRSVQAAIEAWRIAGTDVVVHHGRSLNLAIYAYVIFKPGYTVSTVQTGINAAVASLLSNLGFGGTLQISDLLATMWGVLGVDSVRLLTSDDMTTKTISGATNASPIVVTTTTNHGLAVNDLVIIDGVVGNTGANGTWVVSAVGSSTQFTLKDSVGTGAWSSGGRVVPTHFGVKILSDDTTTLYPDRFITGGDGTPYRAKDIYADDQEFFTVSSITITSKAQNSMGIA